MANYCTKLIGVLLIPVAIFVLGSPLQAEATEQFEMKSSLVIPAGTNPSDFDFKKGSVRVTVNGDDFKARVKFNKLTGTLLESATSLSLVLECRASRVNIDGSFLEVSLPLTVDVPLDDVIKGKNLRYKEKGSLSSLPALLGLPSDVEDGDVLEVLGMRIDLGDVIVAVPGFRADLSKDKDEDKDDS